jgi:hypothetical protein
MVRRRLDDHGRGRGTIDGVIGGWLVTCVVLAAGCGRIGFDRPWTGREHLTAPLANAREPREAGRCAPGLFLTTRACL